MREITELSSNNRKKLHKDVLPVTGRLASRRDIHNNRSMSVPRQLVNDLIIPLMTADNIGSKSIAFPQQQYPTSSPLQLNRFEKKQKTETFQCLLFALDSLILSGWSH